MLCLTIWWILEDIRDLTPWKNIMAAKHETQFYAMNYTMTKEPITIC